MVQLNKNYNLWILSYSINFISL